MRKIIQILISKAKAPDETQNVIYALCDGGTLWWRNEKGIEWYCEPDIPQENNF
jgi:hypothetical protein